MPWFTKQRKKKARNTLLCLWGENFGFFGQIQGRFRPYRPYWSPAATTWYGRYGPILAESAWFGANWSRFGTNRAASVRLSLVGVNPRKKKKKNSDMAPMCGQPRRTPRPVLSRVGHGCSILPAMSVLSRFEGSKIIARLSIWRASLFHRHFVWLVWSLGTHIWWLHYDVYRLFFSCT